MWPWAHLAVGYLCYAGALFARDRSKPRGLAVVALAVGTQVSDLVDKPVAYWTTLLPAGRTFTHSLLVAVPLSAAVLYATESGDPRTRRAGGAFVLGYLSHLLADGIVPLLGGRMGELSFLLWPLFPVPDYEASSFGHHWQQLRVLLTDLPSGGVLRAATDPFVVQLWLTLVAGALWVVQGAPPLARLRAWRAAKRATAE